MESKLTPEQFVYWLQGYMEVENPKQLTPKQTQIVKDHLEKVFTKVTPERNKPGFKTLTGDKIDYEIPKKNKAIICSTVGPVIFC